MPAYVTAPELEKAIGTEAYLALVDRDGDSNPDLSAVTEALLKASGFADGYISRYLPLASAPEGLKQAVIDIAIYRLASEHATEDQRLRYEDARRWLEMVAKGSISLGAIDDDGSDSDLDIEVEGPDQVMSRSQTAGVL